jgi:hypothetical protein
MQLDEDKFIYTQLNQLFGGVRGLIMHPVCLEKYLRMDNSVVPTN